MQRSLRQQKILEIIATKEIDTQEELCDELIKANFNVTALQKNINTQVLTAMLTALPTE